ncbi:hypothetical protein GPJ56_007127 [Histomonas meleagridis]|uniref:uncharacterized protein n=1 Tax=Histomonas meleagridis TaxID=135588 RepID=UPI00355A66CD|nr:hypothetical protein GPJ56_007127 [Histomonas meleagridis]KAH0806210.1 hypothetical protein GO595_000898 [Histomonas meleagridis]
MAAAAWIFKLKKQLTNGYMMIGDDGNNQATFSMEDIRNLSIDQEIFNQGTTWEEGMPLPPQPSIVTEKTENHQKDEIETKKEEEEKNENVDAASNEML